MLKRFLCGAALTAALLGAGFTPVQAEELYVRNRLFKDAYFVGSTTYVPVDGFLKAVRVPWSLSGSNVTLGKGSSPDIGSGSEQLAFFKDGKRLDLSGQVRGGKLYVPAKDLAKFVGYGVIYNRATGVVDVVKARFTNEQDEQAATDLVAAKEAAKAERDAAWQARVEKAKADRKAKEEAEMAESGEGEDEEGLDEDSDEDVADETSDEDVEDTESAKSKDEDTTEEEVEKKPPPEADLVVLSTDANPNYYTGVVTFRAVLQNQGYAKATDVRAKFVVIGPTDKEKGKTQWISKNMYHGPIDPDGRWEIVQEYKHRAGASMPRGDFEIKVTPAFKSEAPKE